MIVCGKESCPEQCSGQPAQTKEGMKGRHDRAPRTLLKRGGLTVHRYIHETVKEPERYKRQHKRERTAADNRQDGRKTQAKGGGSSHKLTAETFNDPAPQCHAEKQSKGGGPKTKPQLSIIQT